MTTGPPDFVGVGVPKCGTSWWFNLILAHPDIHGPIKKELLFFNRIFFERHGARAPPRRGARGLPPVVPAAAGAKTGEWTPSYLFSHRLPPILRRAAPDAKILVLLRDPVDRYQSDISRRMPRRRLRNVRYRGLVHGLYAAELEPWEAVFAPVGDAGHAVRGVRPPTRPSQLAATYRFLGLDDTFCPPELRDAGQQDQDQTGRGRRVRAPAGRDATSATWSPWPPATPRSTSPSGPHFSPSGRGARRVRRLIGCSPRARRHRCSARCIGSTG